MANAASFLTKAEESLASAVSDLQGARYNACARNSYYALFQAAVAALIDEDVRPAGRWEHKFVDARFSGLLVYRRKRYSARFRAVLSEAFRVRVSADYTDQPTLAAKARHTLESARELVMVVKERQDGHS